ncbi:MAG: hypothetical protein H6807_10690 [Planctomycetes bacterium]|nr:hypothetical protein [Planctomycetota bacterium]
MYKILPALLLAAAAFWFWPRSFEAEIRLDPGVEYQTIAGWSALTPAWWGQPDFAAYGDDLLRRGYLDLGLTRFRLEVRSGSEAPVDENARMRGKEIPFSEYRKYWYRPVNDDDDPRHVEAGGFHFSELDGTVEQVVLPLRKILAEAGRKLDVNLCYVSFQKQSLPSAVHFDPEEYAEFALATVSHLKAKYDLVPDTWQLHLEPDAVPGWSGSLLGGCIVATQRRFEEAGFRIGFVGPSTTSAANAVPWLEAMLKVKGAKEALVEFGYHRYRGDDAATLTAIGAAAEARGVRSAMLEKIGAWNEQLLQDLTLARVSTWMQYSLGGPKPAGEKPSGYFYVDQSDPEQPVVKEHPKTRFLRQYFRYVRPGAIRIGATSSAGDARVVAFRNTDGKLAIVLDCKSAGDFELKDLPAGRYVLEYSTAAVRAERGEERTLAAGRSFVGAIPAAGVATLIQLD